MAVTQSASVSPLLKHMYEDQRAELSYRRSREFQVFSWSATLLVAATGALIVIDPDELSLLAAHPIVGRIWGSVVLGGLAYLSAEWQRTQWSQADHHKRMLAQIAEALGCFASDIEDRPHYPSSWKRWGQRPHTYRRIAQFPNKVLATLMLGLVAISTLWWPYLLGSEEANFSVSAAPFLLDGAAAIVVTVGLTISMAGARRASAALPITGTDPNGYGEVTGLGPTKELIGKQRSAWRLLVLGFFFQFAGALGIVFMAIWRASVAA